MFKQFLVFTIAFLFSVTALNTVGYSLQATQAGRRINEDTRIRLEKYEKRREIPSKIDARPETSEEAEYFDELVERKTVYIYDCLNVIATILGLNVDVRGQEEVLGNLETEGIIEKGIAREVYLNKPLRKGEASVLIARALDIRGGVMMRVFPRSERYAFRELIYEEIMAGGYEQEVMTGRELAYVFIKSAEYTEKYAGGATR